MKIQGLQKLSLVDYPGITACTVFLGGCNFRCPFCHNPDLVLPERFGAAVEEDELYRFLQKRSRVLDGVCISGGEPLIHKELPKLLEKIKSLGYLIKLDTNGSFPGRLREMYKARLIDYVAMDIKNSMRSYATTIGAEHADLTSVMESAAFLLEGNLSYEFRTTVVREYHEERDFEEIGKWLMGAERYYLQTFSDEHGVLCDGLHACGEETMLNFLRILRRYIPKAEWRKI